jgi:hypothetical protein
VNFKATTTLQGSLGLLVSLVLFAKPDLLLMFVAPPGSSTALSATLVRLLGLFIGALCVTLVATRSASEVATQRNVLLTHMAVDLLAFVVIAALTSMGSLMSPGGYVLAVFLLVNAVGYVPCYWKLSHA